MKRLKQIEFWMYGLASTFLFGCIGSMGSDEVVTMMHRFGSATEPLTLKQIAAMFVAGGITAAGAYLKASPLPPLIDGTGAAANGTKPPKLEEVAATVESLLAEARAAKEKATVAAAEAALAALAAAPAPAPKPSITI